MAIYDWREFEDFDLANRFPQRPDIVGADQWQLLLMTIRDLPLFEEDVAVAAALFRTFDRFVQAVSALPPVAVANRVFVSHQRYDLAKAERIAWQVTEVGFEYWLDVHDPALKFANHAALPPQVRAILIAAIIEMALLNCSHVVAVQTPHSQKSRWVPYEFGRAKQRVPVSSSSASWFESGITPDPNGDYLSLAFCAMTEGQLVAWLRRQPGARAAKPNTLWPLTNRPNPLPN